MIDEYALDGVTYVAQKITVENDVYGKRCVGCCFLDDLSCVNAPRCSHVGVDNQDNQDNYIIWVVKE